jgi:hypothetical protein
MYYKMKLKTAITIIESSYITLAVTAMLGIAASFFLVKREYLIFTIVSLCALMIIAFLLKLNLIKLYLKKCKYPYEFLSVLEQLKLTNDIQINWGDLINGPEKSQLYTQQFLEDNNLSTEIGERKKNSIPLALMLIGSSLIGLIYLSQKVSLKDKPVIFISLGIFLISGIYLWSKSKKIENSDSPVLLFTSKGLTLDGITYHWDKIKTWVYEKGGENSKGQMGISYENAGGGYSLVYVDLDLVNIDKLDLMLLLTHFKAKYNVL